MKGDAPVNATTPPVNAPDPDPEQTALVAIGRAANALIDPDVIVDAVGVQLDALASGGADPQRLDVIHDASRDLAEQAHTLHNQVRTALEIARSVREQREAARGKLDALRRAMDDIDLDVPEVEEMYQAVEEMTMDWAWEVAADNLHDEIVSNTPLDWREAGNLIDLINGDGPALDDPRWHELRDWLRHMRQEVLIDEDE